MGRPSTPWSDPRPGDVCVRPASRVRASGKSRKVRQVGRKPGSPRLGTDLVVYEQATETKTCSVEQWATWCRRAREDGGYYERDGRQYRIEDGLFDGTDHA